MTNRIKEARLLAGYSQKAVALTLHVAAPSVSEWESGKKSPTTENLLKLADMFGVSTDYLLGRSVENPFFIWLSAEKKDALDRCLTESCRRNDCTEQFVVSHCHVENFFPRLRDKSAGICPVVDIMKVAKYLDISDVVEQIYQDPSLQQADERTQDTCSRIAAEQYAYRRDLENHLEHQLQLLKEAYESTGKSIKELDTAVHTFNTK